MSQHKIQFKELHFSSNLSMEARKIMKELKTEKSPAARKNLEERLERVHDLQNRMKQGVISDAYVSILAKEDFDVVAFIEKFSKEHPVSPKKKDTKSKNSDVLEYLWELIVGKKEKAKIVTLTSEVMPSISKIREKQKCTK